MENPQFIKLINKYLFENYVILYNRIHDAKENQKIGYYIATEISKIFSIDFQDGLSILKNWAFEFGLHPDEWEMAFARKIMDCSAETIQDLGADSFHSYLLADMLIKKLGKENCGELINSRLFGMRELNNELTKLGFKLWLDDKIDSKTGEMSLMLGYY